MSIENVIGTPAADIIIGSDVANRLVGGGGADGVSGGDGDDLLFSHTGPLSLIGPYTNLSSSDTGAEIDTLAGERRELTGCTRGTATMSMAARTLTISPSTSWARRPA